MNAATKGLNMKWEHRFQTGGGTPVPPLATALPVVNLVRAVALVKFICCC